MGRRNGRPGTASRFLGIGSEVECEAGYLEVDIHPSHGSVVVPPLRSREGRNSFSAEIGQSPGNIVHTEGDLYCRVVVETPVNLTSEQRELLEKFEATFSGEEARKHSPKSATFLDGVKGFWDRMTS